MFKAWVYGFVAAVVAYAVLGLTTDIADAAKPKKAKPLLKIAVIDTGYDFARLRKDKLCDSSLHRDFTGEGLGSDVIRHGSNVSSLIMDAAGDADYCLVILKVFDAEGIGNVKITTKALAYAAEINVDIINLSITGRENDKKEQGVIKRLLDKGVFVVAAAGNDTANMNAGCIVFPACSDPRVIVAGCIDCPFSNFGQPVDTLERGMNRKGGGVVMSGTSMATATATGRLTKLISNWYTKYNNKKNRRKQLFKLFTKED